MESRNGEVHEGCGNWKGEGPGSRPKHSMVWWVGRAVERPLRQVEQGIPKALQQMVIPQ